MKVEAEWIFDTKKHISFNFIPFVNFEFGNYYQHYENYLVVGWLCFYLSFEWKVNKNR